MAAGRARTKAGYETKASAEGLVHPAERGLISIGTWREETNGQTTIFTDATRLNGRTGIAVVERDAEGRWREAKRERIDDHAEVNQAETEAIAVAVRIARDREATDIVSDARSALGQIAATKHTSEAARNIYKQIVDIKRSGKAVRLWWTKGHDNTPGNKAADEEARKATETETITRRVKKSRGLAKRERKEAINAEWQADWDRGKTGRLTYKHIRKVSTDMIPLNRKAVQLITGHGNMAAYIKRFRLKEQEDGTCECGTGEETAEHIWEDCTTRERRTAREELIQELEEHGIEWPITTPNYDEKTWRAVSNFAGKVIRDEEVETND